MKLALVRGSDRVVARETNVTGVYPPLGLAYLAAYVRERGHQPLIFDGDAPRRPAGTLLAEIPDDIQLLGVSCTSLGWSTARELARLARRRFPSVPLVVGGPQVTAFPAESLLHSQFDLGVIGDGEVTLAAICDRIEAGQPLVGLPGAVWREGDEVKVDHDVPWCRDLDALPMPALELLPMRHYNSVVVRAPYVAMVASRGCPYRCAFCSQIYTGDHFRTHSPARLLAEMERAEKLFGAREIVLFDETFGVRRREALEFCEQLAQRGHSCRWNARTRIDLLDRELLQAMRRAGCYMLHLGIESGSQEVLDRMGKKTTIDQIEQVVHAAHELGYQLHGYFMLGYPGESEAQMRRTMAFSRRLPLNWASYTITIPNPRTRLQEEAEREGLVSPTFWLDHIAGRTDGTIPYVAAPIHGAARLEALKREAYLRFYLRPTTLVAQSAFVWRTGGLSRLAAAATLWLREVK